MTAPRITAPVLRRDRETGASVALSGSTACLRGASREDGGFKITDVGTVGELWPGERAIVFGTPNAHGRAVMLDLVCASRGTA